MGHSDVYGARCIIAKPLSQLKTLQIKSQTIHLFFCLWREGPSRTKKPMDFTKRKTKSIITESASAADEATRSRFSSLYAFCISEEDVGGVHVGAILVIMTAGIDESGFAGTSMADHGVGLLEQAEANGVLLHNGRVGIEHHQIDLSLLVVLANSFGDGPLY